MDSNQHTKKKILTETVMEDVFLTFSLIAVIFGAIGGVPYAEKMKQKNGFSGDFTDIAIETAGDRSYYGMLAVGRDFFYELGWSGAGADTIAVADRFFFNPINTISTTKTTSPFIALLQTPTEGAVLGSQTGSKPGRVVRGANGRLSFYLEGTAEDQTIIVEYLSEAPHVKQVEFYLDGNLVTTDKSAPYFLGGDDDGQARGVSQSQLRQTKTVSVRVVLDNPPLYTIETDSFSTSEL